VLLPGLLASRAGQHLLDPTPPTDHATIRALRLVCRRRPLGLAWRVLPQQARWSNPQIR
jgi:hypothetical protein